MVEIIGFTPSPLCAPLYIFLVHKWKCMYGTQSPLPGSIAPLYHTTISRESHATVRMLRPKLKFHHVWMVLIRSMFNPNEVLQRLEPEPCPTKYKFLTTKSTPIWCLTFVYLLLQSKLITNTYNTLILFLECSSPQYSIIFCYISFRFLSFYDLLLICPQVCHLMLYATDR